jgi:hypothetical protein
LKLQDSPVRESAYALAIVGGDRRSPTQVAAVHGRRDEVSMVGARLAAATYWAR